METTSKLLFLIPLLPLAGAFLNLFVWRILAPTTGKYRQSDSLTHTTAILSVFAAFCLSVYLVGGPLWDMFKAWRDGGKPEVMGGLTQHVWTWIEVGNLKIDMAFRLDTLTAVMLLVITGIGTLIHIYSAGYMHGEKRYPAYFGYLNLFTGMMLILVLGDSLPIMFIGWEGVGLCSYLLIGFYFDEHKNANAGRKAFVANRVGDFAFLLGMCLLFWGMMNAGVDPSLDFNALQRPEVIETLSTNYSFLSGERLAFAVGVLFFIGACGKSAQIPLYVWLPDAMAGPTPVSALIHAATMVTAGVYMIARMSFLYAHSTTAMAIVAGVGAATALFAAIMAFAQTDLKKVLAYSTVSQLGFMFVGVGVGAYTAGVFHLITHAFFKAGLFLAAGSVMHAMSGSGDITKMGGLRKKLPLTHISFLIYCLAIAGVFPFAGFFSKDEILAGAFGAHGAGWAAAYGEVLWVVLSIAALGTAFYMFRLYFLVFSGTCRADEETKSHIHESPASMTVPLLILALFATVIGFIGLPHLQSLHLPNVLHEWLSPTLVDFDRASIAGTVKEAHFSDGALIGLMGLALAIGIVGIVAAYALYGRGPSQWVDAKVKTPFGAKVHDIVYNKFYVDEIYDRFIYEPFRVTCRVLHGWVDRYLIDDIIVNGSARVAAGFSSAARWAQNGQVQRYMALMVIGGAVLFWYASKPEVSFKYEQTGPNTVEFRPDVGDGLDSKGAIIEFDLDLDGEPDATQRYVPGQPFVVKGHFGGAGKYKVKMTMTDSVFKKKYTATRTVVVKGPEGTDDTDAAAAKGGAQ